MRGLKLFASVLLPLSFAGACGQDERPAVVVAGMGGAAGGADGAIEGPSEPTELVLTGVVLPAEIEAEDFVLALERDAAQEGDPDCASDVDPGVDIESGSDRSGGCSVGYAAAGEWLEYAVSVEETAAFDVTVWVGSDLLGQQLGLWVDGAYRGSFEVPSIGWESFEAVTLEGIGLIAGNHQVRISFDTGAVNFDKLAFESAGECVPACEERSCGDDFCGGVCGVCEEGESCTDSGTCKGKFPAPVPLYGQLAVQGGKIVDENGSPVALRGVSTQWLNWELHYSTSKEAMQALRDDWGMQVFRIANGVENGNGYAQDPETRMEIVKRIIDHAIELDVYVIVDWHTHEASYIDLAKDFFEEIATEYGDLPNILYEPFNEPIGPFNTPDQPDATETYWADTLKPYHEELVSTIRAIDDNNLILLGTPRWSQMVNVAAADPVAGTNLAYVLHFYSCSHTGWLRDIAQMALDDGVALYVSEWASTHADGGTDSNPGTCLPAADDWHRWLDERDIGSAAWKLNDDGDESAILTLNAPTNGQWDDEDLSTHGRYVRDLLQNGGVPD